MNRIFLGGLAIVLLCAGVVMAVVAFASTRRTESVTARFPNPQPPATLDQSEKADGWLTRYELTERSGRKFRSEELQGKVHVVNFFFAKCPTFCRVQTAAVQALHNEFAAKGVVFLSITCDPENDTPV